LSLDELESKRRELGQCNVVVSPIFDLDGGRSIYYRCMPRQAEPLTKLFATGLALLAMYGDNAFFMPQRASRGRHKYNELDVTN